jgi:outer membrane biosynthesis protein TonB
MSALSALLATAACASTPSYEARARAATAALPACTAESRAGADRDAPRRDARGGLYEVGDSAIAVPAVPVEGNPSPAGAQRRGEVLVQFVVDTAGRVEPDSPRVLRSADPALSRAVLDILPRHAFVSARTRFGCPVRFQVMRPFEF